MWDWYEWDTLADFDIWHKTIKIQLGLPKQSININGNSIDDPIIENYTSPTYSYNKVIAMVEHQYAQYLTTTNTRPIKTPNEYTDL
jgi:hypothetical protein